MNNADFYDDIVKIILVGDSFAGKTSIASVYTDGLFPYEYMETIGVEYHIKLFDYKKRRIKVCIWDTSGKPKYRSIIRKYYLDAELFVLVFDLQNNDIINKIDRWLDEIINIRQDMKRTDIIIIGNKIDANIENTDISSTISVRTGNIVYETCVVDKKNIDEIFNQMVIKILQSRKSFSNSFNNHPSKSQRRYSNYSCSNCTLI